MCDILPSVLELHVAEDLLDFLRRGESLSSAYCFCSRLADGYPFGGTTKGGEVRTYLSHLTRLTSSRQALTHYSDVGQKAADSEV